MMRALLVGLAISCGAPHPTRINNSTHAPSEADRLTRVADDALAAMLRPNYRRPFEPSETRYAPVRALYFDACLAGNRRACWIIPQLRDPGDEKRDDSADGLIASNCIAGDVMSCRALGDDDQRRGVPGWMGRSDCNSQHCDLGALLHECAIGLPRSCYSAIGEDGLSKQRAQEVHNRYLALAIDGCKQGLLNECQSLFDHVELHERRTDEITVAAHICLITGQHCGNADDGSMVERDTMERWCQIVPRRVRRNACSFLVKQYAAHTYPEPVPNRFVDLRDWYCREPVFPMPEICAAADLKRPIP